MVWGDVMFSSFYRNRFNINHSLYNVPNFYMNYYYFGQKKMGNLIGPNGANSGSFNKKDSFLKCFSESLERMGMFENTDANGDLIVYDVIDKKTKRIKKSRLGFNLDFKKFSDTTGTASSLSSDQLCKKAVTELIEKNALFLFWYGNEVKKVPNKYAENLISVNSILEKGSLQYDLYCVDFGLVHTIISIVREKNGHFYSAGVSGDIFFKNAIKNSLEEAITLGWADHTRHDINENIFPADYWIDSDNSLKFLDKKEKTEYLYNGGDNDKNFQELLDSFPKWITSIWISILPSASSYSRLTTILAYSIDLYNGVPGKEEVNLEKQINKKTLNLNAKELQKIPSIIIR